MDSNSALSFDCPDSSLANDTGLNVRSLLDLQKFLACSKILKYPAFDNAQKTELKAVASCNFFSARVGLVFKASESLRLGREDERNSRDKTGQCRSAQNHLL